MNGPSRNGSTRCSKEQCRDRWLSALQGSILFDFEKEPQGWAHYFDGMSDIRHASGPVDDMLQGTGNLCSDARRLGIVAAPWFDPAFALTGGEDRDFFDAAACRRRFLCLERRSARAHLRAGHARQSELGAGARLYHRQFRHAGASEVPAGSALLVARVAKIAGALLLSPPLFAILVFDANRRTNALRRMYRAAGKINALFGRQYNEYSVIHGQ